MSGDELAIFEARKIPRNFPIRIANSSGKRPLTFVFSPKLRCKKIINGSSLDYLHEAISTANNWLFVGDSRRFSIKTTEAIAEM